METSSPEANYLTRANIVVPAHYTAARITEMEAAARATIAERHGISSVSGGSIKKAAK